MPQPFNYALNLPDPTSKITDALQLAATMSLMKQKSTAAEQKQKLQDQFQNDVKSLGANPTPGAVANLSVKYPHLSEKFQKTYEMLSSEQQQAHVNVASQVYASLLGGNTDIAQDVLKQRIEAAENSGNEEEAKTMTTMLKLIQLNPETAKLSAGMFLSNAMGKDQFIETFSKLEETRRTTELHPGALKKQNAELKKMGADLKLTKAQTNEVLVKTNKMKQETRKAILELEAMEKGETADPAKRFEQEDKLRKEYTNRTKSFVQSQDAFRKIEASSLDESGAADIALVTSFMKMLDPGSVVRETEFATARDTAGLYTRLQNAAEKLQTGRFLDSTQRKAFTNLSRQYMKAAEKQEKTVRNNIEKVVDNYKLNPENVFPEIEPVGEEPADENTVTIGDQTFTRPEGFTDEQWNAYKQSQGVQ